MRFWRLILGLWLVALNLKGQSQDSCLNKSFALGNSSKSSEVCAETGLCLVGVEVSDCLVNKSESPIEEGIHTLSAKGDSILKITIITTVDCSHKFMTELEMMKKGVLSLNYTDFGGVSACMCEYLVTYILKKEKGEDYHKVEVLVINGNNATKRKVSL